MTEKTIQYALLRTFASHQYKFTNAYFFSNESDFLSFLPSGFCYEIEIKISRSDFKADFKKEKHVIHGSNEVKSATFLRKVKENRIYNPDWDFCRNFPQLIIAEERHGNRYRHNNRNAEIEIDFHAIVSTEIEFVPTKKTMLPNKFFYAVPHGLIQKSEVPDYAGLLYICDDQTVLKVKDGKFLHKDKLDVRKLFNKTYHAYLTHLYDKLRPNPKPTTL